jgi:uroporphyrinogen-III decarboxylase
LYRVGLWWYWLFERHWSLRGMENALCDFYDSAEEVHRLYRALTDFYKDMLLRGRRELGLDAVWTSDDIGTQTAPFFSLEIFRTFFKPYYRELIDCAHELGMHFWLHCCGNILPFLPELIEIGLDVLHPIQKYAMDEREVARRYGDQLCIWAGFDVQQSIPYGTPEDVRREVRFMIDTYFRSDGRFLLAAGNNMTPDTPLESLDALLDESVRYGTQAVLRAL